MWARTLSRLHGFWASGTGVLVTCFQLLAWMEVRPPPRVCSPVAGTLGAACWMGRGASPRLPPALVQTAPPLLPCLRLTCLCPALSALSDSSYFLRLALAASMGALRLGVRPAQDTASGPRAGTGRARRAGAGLRADLRAPRKALARPHCSPDLEHDSRGLPPAPSWQGSVSPGSRMQGWSWEARPACRGRRETEATSQLSAAFPAPSVVGTQGWAAGGDQPWLGVLPQMPHGGSSAPSPCALLTAKPPHSVGRAPAPGNWELLPTGPRSLAWPACPAAGAGTPSPSGAPGGGWGAGE